MIGQTFLSNTLTGRTDCQKFGMRRRIVQFASAVARLRHNLTRGIDDDRPDGDFTAGRRRARLEKRDMHERPKAHIPSCDVKATFAS